jgi:putative restriction endonuclease
MSINLVVAVTDGDWFELLRRLPNLKEVNFWSPSDTNFRALSAGELFLFKLHAPVNKIVGGGVFAYSTSLPISLAWDSFGQANGARTKQDVRARIAKYRRVDRAGHDDFPIGCRILTQPFFFDEYDWLPVPASWSGNIVAFKKYSTADGEGAALWQSVSDRIARATPQAMETGERFGAPHLIAPRLGQGAFRAVVIDSYLRRCAVTGEKTLPALEAAHIRPYSDGGPHDPSNGILLRRDLHSLFDSGYVTITPNLDFEVSRRIREEFQNGRHYYALHGQKIAVPDVVYRRPNRDALIWHNENRFKG